MKNEAIEVFLKSVMNWLPNHIDIIAALLVGSHAQGTAHADSDIDLIFFTNDYSDWITNHRWAEQFGKIKNTSSEDWGAVKTVRVFFEGNFEVEFNFANPSWASINPIDPGTFRVISDGVKILYDPNYKLKQLVDAVGKKNN